MLLIGFLLGAMLVPLIAESVTTENPHIHQSETFGVLLESATILPALSPSAHGTIALSDDGAIRAMHAPRSPKNTPERRFLPKDEEYMLRYIEEKESQGNPLAQNPKSTAFGRFQFLDSTWATVGCKKTSDPIEQERCALLYMEQRYGGIEGAYYFHKRMGWY